MFRSIRVQLAAIFLAYTFLVGGAFAATFFFMQDHASDDAKIEIVLDLRAQLRRIAWLALAEPESPTLASEMQRFEHNLLSLSRGGAATDSEGKTVLVQPIADPSLRAQLDAIAQSWPDFKKQLELVATLAPEDPAFPAAALALEADLIKVIDPIESLVTSYEDNSHEDHARLLNVQIACFAAVVPLIALGFYLIRVRLIGPLTKLEQATQRIQAGDLSQPVMAVNEDEIGHLAHSFDAMRVEIAASKESLETRVASRTRELANTLEFTQNIFGQLDSPELLQSVATSARTLMQAQDAFVCLMAPDGEHLELMADSNGPVPGDRPRQPIQRAQEIVGGGPALATQVANSTCGLLKRSPAKPSDHCLAIPLQLGRHVIGSLCVVRDQPSTLDQDEMQAFRLLANSAAIAITNARLIEIGRRQAEQAAKQAERQRLSAELHDYLAQTLGLIQLQASQVAGMLSAGQTLDARSKLDHLKLNASTAYAQVRAALDGLSAKSVQGVTDLRKEIEERVADFRAQTSLPVALSISNLPWQALPSVTQRQILLILHEALANVRRHAQARSVQISLERDDGDRVQMMVEDDGIGFNPDRLASEHSLGLKIMQARVERSGGCLSIESTPGSGTKVTAHFPLSESS